MIGDPPPRPALNAVVNPEGIYLAVDGEPLVLLDPGEVEKLVALLKDAVSLYTSRFVAWGGVSERRQ